MNIRSSLRMLVVLTFFSMFLVVNSANSYSPTDLVIVVKTDNMGLPGQTTNNNQYFLQAGNDIVGSPDFNFNVDCESDGIFEYTNRDGGVTCTYDNPGTYEIVVNGYFPRFQVNGGLDKLKLLEIKQWGDQQFDSFRYAFYGAANLQITATDTPDLSNVTSMEYAFLHATNMNSPIGNWDTANITNMHAMFQQATSFNQNINNWNVENVTNFSEMFLNARSFNQPLDQWITSSATDTSSMFFIAEAFNQPLNTFDVSQVTNMNHMLGGMLVFNQDLNSWDVSNATDMSYLFSGDYAFNGDISDWTPSSAVNMEGMFGGNWVFNQDISSWDTTNVTNMKYMFAGAAQFNQPIYSWNVENVTTMEQMFNLAQDFDQPLGAWNPINVTNMTNMFGTHTNNGAQDPTLSITNYDNLLISWSTKALQNGVTLDGLNNFYCAGDIPRTTILFTYSWIINDAGYGGVNCPLNLSAPAVSTGPLVIASQTSAVVKAILISDGGAPVFDLGIEYGLTTSYGETKIAETNTPGLYEITGGGDVNLDNVLECNTEYHYRAYAENSVGKVYGIDRTFTTASCSVPLDIDFAISGELLNPGFVIEGDTATYILNIKNLGLDSYTGISLNMNFIIPPSVDYESAAIENSSDFNITCEDLGIASALSMPSFSAYQGHVIVCTINNLDLDFINNESFDIELQANVLTDFVDNVDALHAMVYSGSYEDDEQTEIGDELEAGRSPFLLSNNNNISNVVYSFVDEPVITTTTTTTTPVTQDSTTTTTPVTQDSTTTTKPGDTTTTTVPSVTVLSNTTPSNGSSTQTNRGVIGSLPTTGTFVVLQILVATACIAVGSILRRKKRISNKV